MPSPRNYESITNEALRFAESAVSNGWLFDEYILAARQAWVIHHEDALKQAKYQVDRDARRAHENQT